MVKAHGHVKISDLRDWDLRCRSGRRRHLFLPKAPLAAQAPRRAGVVGRPSVVHSGHKKTYKPVFSLAMPRLAPILMAEMLPLYQVEVVVTPVMTVVASPYHTGRWSRRWSPRLFGGIVDAVSQPRCYTGWSTLLEVGAIGGVQLLCPPTARVHCIHC